MNDIEFCKIEIGYRIDDLKKKPKSEDEERDLMLFEAIMAILERIEPVNEFMERCIDDGL